MSQSGVDRLHIFLHDVFALAAVGVANGLADRLDGFVARQNFRDGEEAHLHDGVHARTHAGFLRDLVGIDRVELGFLGDELRLYLAGQMVPDFIIGRTDC